MYQYHNFFLLCALFFKISSSYSLQLTEVTCFRVALIGERQPMYQTVPPPRFCLYLLAFDNAGQRIEPQLLYSNRFAAWNFYVGDAILIILSLETLKIGYFWYLIKLFSSIDMFSYSVQMRKISVFFFGLISLKFPLLCATWSAK